jgi:predicted CXXCH cytochrome family protein
MEPTTCRPFPNLLPFFLRFQTALLGLGIALASAGPAAAVDACTDCHDDVTLAAGVHADVGCNDCHDVAADHPDSGAPPKPAADLCASCHDGAPGELGAGAHAALASEGRAGCVKCHGDPHVIRGAVGALDGCTACHAPVVALQRESLHGKAHAKGDKLAPTCVTCHGGHKVVPRSDPKSPVAVRNVPLLCGQCHKEGTAVSRFRDIPQDAILEHYADSIHGEGLFKKGLTVTAVCSSCHTAHAILPHTDPKSSIAHVNVSKTCMQCHGDIEQVHRKVIEGKLWEESPQRIPVCVECHAPHAVRKVFYDAGASNADCLSCHGKPDLAKEVDGREVSLFVDGERYAGSTHAKIACAQCHSEVAPSHERPCDAITRKVDCAVCHADPAAQYARSIHGKLSAQGDPDAPVCLDCHDRHDTQSKRSPASPTFARNVPELCARCHRAGEKAAVRIDADVPDIVASYADSIHGKGLTESGLVVTATCVNCHSSHGELPPDDPASTVNRANLPATCGQCHHGVAETFAKSIHATGDPKEGQQLPVCEDCHSSHSIRRADSPGFRTRMMEQCGKCHGEQAESFFETFHGKVSRLGAEGAAKCSDCHGSHDILPVADPASHLSRANVVATCAQCHEGSHRRFAGYLTHATHHDRERFPWLFWSFRLMTLLLVGTLAFALLHTLAWLVRLWLSREEWQRVKALSRTEGQGRLYRRFDRFQRGQHLFMLLSFFTLAITGMALKFSYATWAQGFSRLAGGQPTMAVLHRVAAVALILVFLFHVWDVRRRRREAGKTWWQMITGPETILFHPRDLRDLFGSIKWFFGLGPRPRYGRYTYWEKFDYFAVFWGVLVIGSTGFVLWFPELLTRVIPGWSINVATIIHSDEALLAVGFIFTIHFFNTHFRPDKFPMDPVIFTGRITVEELEHDKPGEYDELVRTGKLEEHLVPPFPRGIERAAKIFGFTMLGVGLTLIALIIYAMLFGYQ